MGCRFVKVNPTIVRNSRVPHQTSVFLYNGKSARLTSKLRSPRASVGDCSPNFISCRVGKSMWDRRMRVTIFPQDSTTVSSGVSTRRDERKRGRVLLPTLTYCLVAISQETQETLTERVLPILEKFVAKCLFHHLIWW